MNPHIKLIEKFEDEEELPATWSAGIKAGGYTKEFTEWLAALVTDLEAELESKKRLAAARLKDIEELEAENERLREFKESIREIATTYGDGSVSERMMRIKELLKEKE